MVTSMNYILSLVPVLSIPIITKLLGLLTASMKVLSFTGFVYVSLYNASCFANELFAGINVSL